MLHYPYLKNVGYLPNLHGLELASTLIKCKIYIIYVLDYLLSIIQQVNDAKIE